jgi:hypothetical protein
LLINLRGKVLLEVIYKSKALERICTNYSVAKREYAMDLVHPYRLIIKQGEESIQIVKIIEIEDYH